MFRVSCNIPKSNRYFLQDVHIVQQSIIAFHVTDFDHHTVPSHASSMRYLMKFVIELQNVIGAMADNHNQFHDKSPVASSLIV